MDHADAVHAVVVDVLGPGPALDVDQLAEGRVLELDRHDGALVARLLEVGEVVSGDALAPGLVGHVAHGLEVGGVLAPAVDPHLVLVHHPLGEDVGLEVLGGREGLVAHGAFVRLVLKNTSY